MRNASYQMKSAVPSNIRWETIEWKEITRYVVKLQQRIYRAEVQGNKRRVRDLQRLALHSRAVLLLSIKRVTQTNKGKKTPGIDGETALTGKERIDLYQEMSQKDIRHHRAKPSDRTYIKKKIKEEALQQILENRYYTGMTGEVLCVGLAHDKKLSCLNGEYKL